MTFTATMPRPCAISSAARISRSRAVRFACRIASLSRLLPVAAMRSAWPRLRSTLEIVPTAFSRATAPARRCAGMPTPMPPWTIGKRLRPFSRSVGRSLMIPCLIVVGDALLAHRAAYVGVEVRAAKPLERLAVPRPHERFALEIAHAEATVVVEAAGRKPRVVGDMALGEERPEAQGLPGRAEAPLVTAGRDGARGAARGPGLAVERQPVVLVHVGRDARHRRRHALVLRVVVPDARGVQAAAVPALRLDFVAHAPCLPQVALDHPEVVGAHPRDLVELRRIREIEAELEAVEARLHALADPLGRCHAPVGGEEDVWIAAVAFGEAHRLGEPAAGERL